MFNDKAITSHRLDTGAVLWEYPWKRGHPHVAIPVVLPNNRILVSSGYGTGTELLKIEKHDDWSVESLWKSIRLKSKFANVVFWEGYVYGLDDGILTCLDANSGSRMWKDGRYGHGQIILVGELILLTAESGDLVLIEPTPDEHRELAVFPVFDHKTWNPPALAGEFVLMRNDREAACLRLSVIQ